MFKSSTQQVILESYRLKKFAQKASLTLIGGAFTLLVLVAYWFAGPHTVIMAHVVTYPLTMLAVQLGGFGGTAVAALSIALLVLFLRHLILHCRGDGETPYSIFCLFLALQFFLLHTLFSLSPVLYCSPAGNGQPGFGLMDTLQVSSFCYLVFGILSDWVKNRELAKGAYKNKE